MTRASTIRVRSPHSPVSVFFCLSFVSASRQGSTSSSRAVFAHTSSATPAFSSVCCTLMMNKPCRKPACKPCRKPACRPGVHGPPGMDAPTWSEHPLALALNPLRPSSTANLARPLNGLVLDARAATSSA
eukprot:4511763-Pleurochrysis_carterae.AAC.1